MEQLCANIRQIFSAGNVSHERVEKILSSCSLRKEDWQKYEKFDSSVNYTRNLVEGGEGDRYNLLILCWNPQKGSPIHDHDESSCFLKVLEGELEETKYAVPTKGERLEMTHNAVHGEGTLTYMDNSIGLHSIRNPSDTKVAISLHLYFPPLTKCLKYDEAGNTTSCDIKVN